MVPNILIFFGAGASRAASPLFPLVNDLFKVAGQLVEREINLSESKNMLPVGMDPFWQFMDYMEKKNLWQSTRNFLGAHHLEPILRTRSETLPEIRQSMKSYLGWLLSLNSGKFLTSIEAVVRQIEGIHFNSGVNETRSALNRFLTWLFLRVEKEAALDYQKTPHAFFLKTLLDKGLLSQTMFVSFNYDTVLEKSIRALDATRNINWNPIGGYGFDPAGYYSLKKGRIENGKVLKDGGLTIIKPHGSLAWARKEDDVFPIVDDRGNFGDRPGVPWNNGDLEDIFQRSGLEPAIIAPGRIKRLSGPHSWQTWRALRAAIRTQVKKIVVIGWNIPKTDEEIKERISRYIEARSDEEQIEKLIICDPNASTVFFDRMSAVFMPKRRVHLTEGFEKESDRIIEHLIG
ncbi:MAG: hypothetical protein IPH91_05740 [Elusimicrobia bacterium]|jgi:hypothetical protein|nr:hypothetical protein [Elusimicrobiota bacterium]